MHADDGAVRAQSPANPRQCWVLPFCCLSGFADFPRDVSGLREVAAAEIRQVQA